jgi:hypothetical protein
MLNDEECIKKYMYVEPDIQICAGVSDNVLNVCKGDSGGGLFCKKTDSRWYLAGYFYFWLKIVFFCLFLNTFF